MCLIETATLMLKYEAQKRYQLDWLEGYSDK